MMDRMYKIAILRIDSTERNGYDVSIRDDTTPCLDWQDLWAKGQS